MGPLLVPGGRQWIPRTRGAGSCCQGQRALHRVAQGAVVRATQAGDMEVPVCEDCIQ